MALLDFLKNKNKAEKAQSEVKKTAKTAKETKAKEEKSSPVSFNGVGSVAVKLLKRPHITEKSTYLSGNNKYVFEVYKNSNKIEIKKAVEKLYKTKVLSVNIINIPSKKKRSGRGYGVQSGFKKAIVALPKGQKIDILAQ